MTREQNIKAEIATREWYAEEAIREANSLEVAAGHFEQLINRCEWELSNHLAATFADRQARAFYREEIERLTADLNRYQARIDSLRESARINEETIKQLEHPETLPPLFAAIDNVDELNYMIAGYKERIRRLKGHHGKKARKLQSTIDDWTQERDELIKHFNLAC